ncbi:MAG: response regulator, partial [Nitrospirota bacterium]|nr:response regulator [Nitrospirota bacterium]
NDLLDFSKIEAGRMELDPMDFDLRKAVLEAVQLFTSLAEAKDLRLSCDIRPAVPVFVRGDQGRLRQILANLISNAIKFTERGSITLRVELEGREAPPTEPRDTLHERCDATLRFSVIDTGIGLTAEQQGRLFHAFTQADGSTTRKYGGTGLGLAISKQLVLLMGGTIGIESRQGLGSTFWFMVPFGPPVADDAPPDCDKPAVCIGTADAGPAVAEREESERPLKGTVLLADDNLVNQQVAQAMIESFGCRVDVVANGREALEALLRRSYDLVLMDCQMPEMDGLEAARRIRERETQAQGTGYGVRGESTSNPEPQTPNREPGTPNRMPIVALTAHVRESDRADCLAAGMDDVLTKPFQREGLKGVLMQWLTKNSDERGMMKDTGKTRIADTGLHHAAFGVQHSPLDPQPLEQLRALRQGTHPGLVQRVIGLYLADSPGLLAAMREALRQGDASALERAAHSLKSSSAALGATGLSHRCKALETMGRGKDLAQAEAVLAQVEADLADTHKALNDYLTQQPVEHLAGIK